MRLREMGKSKVIVAATIAILFVVAFFQWLFSLPFYTENEGLAVATALSEAGVTKDELDELLTVADGLFSIQEEGFDVDDFVARSRRVAERFSRLSVDRLAAVGVAFQYPRRVKKSIFASIKYLSLADKAQAVRQTLEERKQIEFAEIDLSKRQWTATAEQIDRLMKNALRHSEREWRDVVVSFRACVRSNGWRETSYKTLKTLAAAAIDSSEDVDFSRFYFADYVFGAGFAERFGGPLTVFASGLRTLEFDRLAEIALLLPDKSAVMVSFVKYAFVERGLSLPALSGMIAALKSFGLIDAGFDEDLLREDVLFLSLAPEDPDETEQAAIDERVRDVFAMFDIPIS